ncbi:MAG: Calx-beta domain-containing protein, partial [Pseudomonadota bacterium]|nr:Calx-beta domain-containing protein [Pseudomonadota bacterium]
AAVQAALGAGTVDFASAAYQMSENRGFAIIEVVRTEGSYGQISVEYTTSDQSAQSNEDYLPVAGTLVWEEGDTAVKTIMIEIINDDILESPETIGLTLFNPTDGACLGTLSEATLTISEPSVLQFSAPIYQVHEHEQWLSIEVTRTNSTQGVVAVDYSTLADSATENSDYLGIQEGTLKWDDGESGSQYIMLELVDDTEVEIEEFLTLFLFNIQGDAQIGTVAAAQVSIIDNDALVSGVIQFATETYPVTAGQPSVTLEVQRIEGAQGAISVDYFTLDDSALTPYDYVAAQGTLHWADDEVVSKYITIGINHSDADELKTFEIKLSNATGGATLGVIAQAQVVIEPEAQPEPLPPQVPQTPINTHLSSEPVDTIDSSRPYKAPPKKQVTIQVNGKGIGSVDSEPFGIHCGNYRAKQNTAHCRSDFAFHCLADGGKQCDYGFNQGEAVTLTPTAGPNSVFMGWGGDPDCADGEITVTSNKQCWAYFSLLHPLTIHRIGSGSVHSYDLTDQANGIHCSPQSQRCIKRFNENHEVVLTATPEEHFIGWQGDCQGHQTTILLKMQQAKTCIARFK